MTQDFNIPDADAYPESGPLRFRLIHIVYVVMVLSSALTTFGPKGIGVAILVAIFWGVVFTNPNRPQAFKGACVVLFVGWCLIGLLLPAVQSAREAAPRMACMNNLKQIALALHNYHDVYKSLPPAPMHSWRVLLLPFLEEQELYDQYKFDEPWNGPDNIKLLNRMPQIYACPSNPGTCTSYVAVVGPNTAWPGQQARTFAELKDGTSNTVLVIEYDNQSIQWLEPRDLVLPQAMQILNGPPESAGGHQSEDFFYVWSSGGRNVALADGSVMFFAIDLAPGVWSEILSTGDGVVIDDDIYNRRTTTGSKPPAPFRHLKVGNCVRLTVFVLICLFPLPWVWWNPHSDRNSRG
jgi:hypothetical protein